MKNRKAIFILVLLCIFQINCKKNIIEEFPQSEMNTIPFPIPTVTKIWLPAIQYELSNIIDEGDIPQIMGSERSGDETITVNATERGFLAIKEYFNETYHENDAMKILSMLHLDRIDTEEMRFSFWPNSFLFSYQYPKWDTLYPSTEELFIDKPIEDLKESMKSLSAPYDTPVHAFYLYDSPLTLETSADIDVDFSTLQINRIGIKTQETVIIEFTDQCSVIQFAPATYESITVENEIIYRIPHHLYFVSILSTKECKDSDLNLTYPATYLMNQLTKTEHIIYLDTEKEQVYIEGENGRFTFIPQYNME